MSSDSIIPPEIKNDEFYTRIIETIQMFGSSIHTVLEVGASSGDGSTEALVNGMSILKDKILYTIEASPMRFKNLVTRYSNLDWVKPINGSSVSLGEYMTKGEVELFYKLNSTQLNQYPLEVILSWYESELDSINSWGIPENVIMGINPDMALLDGSAFCGWSEFQKIAGTKIIVLDDILDIKHYYAHRVLRSDDTYECLFCNLTLRNGYSIWVKKDIL